MTARSLNYFVFAAAVCLLHIATAIAGGCSARKERFEQFVEEFCPKGPPKTCGEVKGPNARTIAVLEGGLEVLCDTQTDDGGWIVFQRRTSAAVDFYRTWLEYKYGFGDLEGNFWLGNEKIYRLSNQRRYELRVDFVHQGNSYYAVYDRFRLTGEDDKYRIQLGAFSGNASDSLGGHNNTVFSTKDRDNDVYDRNCAQIYQGAWWYTKCHSSNLNGLWNNTEYAKGLTWRTTTGYYASATFSEMKIRVVNPSPNFAPEEVYTTTTTIVPEEVYSTTAATAP